MLATPMKRYHLYLVCVFVVFSLTVWLYVQHPPPQSHPPQPPPEYVIGTTYQPTVVAKKFGHDWLGHERWSLEIGDPCVSIEVPADVALGLHPGDKVRVTVTSRFGNCLYSPE